MLSYAMGVWNVTFLSDKIEDKKMRV